MAAGAGDQYWERQKLPSFFKHNLLGRYLPRFGGKTGARGRGIVYLDGFAGRGRYQDGSPASAELILRIAEDQAQQGIRYQLFFHEADKESYGALATVVDEYVARGIQARAEPSEVLTGLPAVLRAAQGLPLFLFLDPCGLGLPFEDLASTLNGSRRTTWPPTEVLLNFSLEAVRRIGGLVASPKPVEKSMVRLDQALGGCWWREYFRRGVTDQAVEDVVRGFVGRLSTAARMHVGAIPVRSAPSHKPVYFLVFGTRSTLGVWHFADDTAEATERWWQEIGAREKARYEAFGQVSLFGDEPVRFLDGVETKARRVIAENIARLVSQHGQCRMGDHPVEVFGDYLGRVRETVVRKAIKDLHASGRTPSDGKGSPIASLVVSPPT